MQTGRRAARVARQLFRLCLVDGRLDEDRARLVVARVIETRRRGTLDILSHFERLVRLDRDRHTAEVSSAVPLPEDLRADVEASIARMYGRGFATSFTHDPALIGGMRLKVGSDVFDGSVRARLASIESLL